MSDYGSAAIPPLVSVVIPTRNRRRLLSRALQSVLTQTYAHIEIILVDDGSEPAVDAAALPACRRPIRVIRNDTTLGAQRSRLVGARAAAGAYVALLDSDDWWESGKIDKQIARAFGSPNAFVSCRVVAARGALRKAAPWRPLTCGEKVEDFLYVQHGMLQTSTVLARTDVLVPLLEATAGAVVHNDTMLFLEAQKRGLDIIQMSEPLSYFDDNPRPDRVSYDAGRVAASLAWFHQVSGDWSEEARKGFMLTDMVTRYVNTRQPRKAIVTLLGAYHPKLGLAAYLKKAAYVACNGSPTRFYRRKFSTLKKISNNA